MKVQFLKPNLNETDIKEAAKVLKSGWITYGPKTKEFEEALKKHFKVGGAVFNSSGTAALHVALIAAGVRPGDEVVTTPLSYVATSNVILYVGAKPIFVDVEPNTGLIDVAAVRRAITKKTKAIIPVHLYGQMADMKKLAALAKKHNLAIIEDAAHSLESKRDGIMSGQKSFAAAFSFHAAKNITSGEGGAVVCKDPHVEEILRLLCEGGVAKGGGKRWMELLGYKYSGTNFQAALLVNQMKRLDSNLKKREKIWKAYAQGLRGVKGLSFPKLIPGAKSAYHMFVIWVDPDKRDKLRSKLADLGVETSIHFNPIHLEPYYRKEFKYKPGMFPVAERLGFSTITLPLYPDLTTAQQNYVIRSVKKVIDESYAA